MWDDDIDEVARALTEARPPADLRARIMARVRHGASRHDALPLWWAFSPLALAILIVGAIALRGGWRTQPAQAPPALAQRTIAPASESLPAPVVGTAIPIAPAIGRRIAITAPPVLADHESAVAPVPPLTVERLNVEHVELKSVTVPDAIAVKTLEMPRLELAPLTPERTKAEGEKDDTTLVRPRRNLDARGRISLRSGGTTSATGT